MNFRSAARYLVPWLLLSGASLAANPRDFTPALMLQNQDIGEARFSVDGRHVYLDQLQAYRDKPNFDLEGDWGRSLSVLSVVDTASGKHAMLQDSPQERTWYLAGSPQGRNVAFGWLDAGVQRIGILDTSNGRAQRLPVSGTGSALPPLWLSEDRLLAISMDAALQDRTVGPTGYSVRQIAEWSAQTWRGKASVKAVGAGRYASAPNQREVELVVVDARNGGIERIDHGTIGMVLKPSPAGGRAAYLRKTGSFDMTGIKLDAMSGAESIDALVIYDLAKGRIPVATCEGCSINDGSLRWSPSGRQLYYSARSREGDRFRYHHYVHDVEAGTSTPFQVQGLQWDMEVEHSRFVAPVLWLDEDRLALRTRDPNAGQFDDQGFRWHLVDRRGEVIRELTAGLPRGDDRQAFKFPVAVHKQALLLVADKALWRLPAEGQARSLTAELGADVDSWCAPYATWRVFNPRCDALESDAIIPPVPGQALDRDRIALRIMRDGVFTGDLAFLDLATTAITRLKRPTPDSELLEASPLTGAALYQRKSAQGDEVLLVRPEAAPVPLHRFNTHLAGVEQARPVLLTRREAGEAEDRNDWLLLPADHKPGQRHPLLVYFYPDTQYRKELKGDDLRDISFLNKNIPVARGYAVLMASMKISDYGKDDGNPMREMHQQLIRAAENAVAKGYVDPERWAIMGHSYGGYGTNSVITQTDRFKAAISLAGPSNLTSGYGIGMNQNKAYAVPEGLNFGALWSEGGQGRMGVPPWRDPQRYIDNSPLFWAHQITTPLMLIHGDQDFVNVNEAEQLFAALHRQGKDVQLIRYWGEGHVYHSPGNIVDMWNRIFGFLDEHLGGHPVAGAAPVAMGTDTGTRGMGHP